MIIDEVVVDVGPYIQHHPGGRFVLRHNIGNNVSKFFHGSYSLEGNLVPGGPDRRVVHSNYARKIVNQLVIAQLDVPGVATQGTICVVNPAKTQKINDTTSAIFLQGQRPEQNFRRFYPGLS